VCGLIGPSVCITYIELSSLFSYCFFNFCILINFHPCLSPSVEIPAVVICMYVLVCMRVGPKDPTLAPRPSMIYCASPFPAVVHLSYSGTFARLTVSLIWVAT
jgi:hypothetical protein